ncbi:hypothetical protein DPEC_G00264490 [Dallia pectoralis]|uniref:Uncharacterized protein n=1 Tax=Dallia pectoralis TaxID=75939 RepID=A0ACC2FSI4_DALPE|nr:hypothetical protein DPEC_G00264490 [Dallia pectoralis]
MQESNTEIVLPVLFTFVQRLYQPDHHTDAPEKEINIGPPNTCHHLPGVSPANTNWERRCLRKHRRSPDDEGCSAKRRRLMEETGCDLLGRSSNVRQNWPPDNRGANLAKLGSQALPEPNLGTQDLELPLSRSPSPPARPEAEGFCMEVEAAQRRLQEIEERITLEDDDEDLEVEPTPRRPVLVMSDSLREGLQRGITDILPHTVAQSVSHSCMELVVWRAPDDVLARNLKDSLQRQRKQQTSSRPPPAPRAPPTHKIPLNPTGETYSPSYCSRGAVALSSGEEDMEL